MRRRIEFWRTLLALALLLGLAAPAQATPVAQTDPALQKARRLLAELTPEERVGQLFLVSFEGNTIDDQSVIYRLITQGHIGGVVLSRANNNFSDFEDVTAGAYRLTSTLQETEWNAANPPEGTAANGQYMPLLVAIAQEGDLYPYDQILSGLTPLPSQMALGATWNTDLARQVGSLQGQELEAIGINMTLGPSLDVLDTLYASGPQDLGVRSFGGDPYWVSEMGKAYILGLHEGGQSRLAVVASHFPGRGSADRSPEAEIATVRKSLEELQDFELEPFFSVTSATPDQSVMTDGLLVSHIRYGIQGNIRDATRPVSFDQNALSLILQLPEFEQWRNGGGVLVSDNLGSPAVKRFFDPTSTSFDGRQVARNAFLAGNDILYVDNFVSTGDTDQTTTITRTLEFFAQRYRQDAVFAQQVDTSAERILTLKYRLYPDFDLEEVTPKENGLAQVNQGGNLVFDVARQATSLISPQTADLPSILPNPPLSTDRILFLTDVVTGRQCSTCADQSPLPVTGLQNAVLSLYGTQAGGSISRSRLTSYSFLDLMMALNEVQDAPTVEQDLALTNWVVVAMLKSDASRPESQAFQRLLSERPELLRGKKVVVFAFNASYDLDATDITKLSAYYGLYSKGPEFVNVAARLLFQDLNPNGALPVSVPGIGYDLFRATMPDPTQVIPLSLDLPDVTPAPETTRTPEPTPVPTFRVGDILPLKTGVIRDHNHHIVPDGTVVRFIFAVGAETEAAQTIDVTTVQGIARTSYRIERTGLLEIRVTSEPAISSDRLRLDVAADAGAAVTAIVPTASPTITLTPSLTPTVQPTNPPTATPTLPPTTGTGDWAISVAAALGLSALALWLGIRLMSVRWGLRWGLCMVIGGLLAYNYLALDLPGSQAVIEQGGKAGILLVTLAGVVLGAVAAWIWRSSRRFNSNRE